MNKTLIETIAEAISKLPPEPNKIYVSPDGKEFKSLKALRQAGYSKGKVKIVKS